MNTVYQNKYKLLYGNTLNSSKPTFKQSDQIQLIGNSGGNTLEFSISDEVISQHSLFLGGTGTGKTNLMYHFVKQIKTHMSKEDVMIIFDTKGDFYTKFFDKNRDFVLGNSSKYINESIPWNIFREIVADGWDYGTIKQNTYEIIDSLLYEEFEHSKDIFFPTAVKEVIISIILKLIKLSIEDEIFKKKNLYNDQLVDFLEHLTPQLLKEFLKNDSEFDSIINYFGDGSNNQSLGIMATLTNVVKRFFIGVFSDRGMFSIRHFIKNKNASTLFIEYDLSLGSSLLPVYRVLYDLALKECLGQENCKGNVYLFCDEFRLLPNLQHISDALNFARSLGVKIFAGLQNVSQLYDLYGENKGNSLLGGFSSIYMFRSTDFLSRKYIKESQGENVGVDIYTGFNNNYIQEKRRGNTIEDWDILSLELGECIVCLPTNPPFSFKASLFKGD